MRTILTLTITLPLAVILPGLARLAAQETCSEAALQYQTAEASASKVGITINSDAIYTSHCPALTSCQLPLPVPIYYLKAVWDSSVLVNLHDSPTMAMNGELHKTKTWTYSTSGTLAEEWEGNVSYRLTNQEPCEDRLDQSEIWPHGGAECEKSVLTWIEKKAIPEPCTPTMATASYAAAYRWNDGVVSASDHQTCTLSEEYTDQRLRDHIVARTPPFQDDWSLGGPGNAGAFFELDAAHKKGRGQRLHYRFRVERPEKDVDYVLRYHLISLLATDQGLEWSDRRSATLPFTGTGEIQYVDAGVVEPPVWTATLPVDSSGAPIGYRMQIFVDVSELSLVRLDGGAGGDPGAPGHGGVEGGGAAVGCSTCGGGLTGGGNNTRPGVGMVIAMGARSHGGSAGFFELAQAEPGDQLTDPASLTYSLPNGIPGQVEVVRDPQTGGIRQVAAPQAIANIVVISADQYVIDIFRAAAKGRLINGRYEIKDPTVNRIVTWRLKDQDQSDQLWITREVPGGPVSEWHYVPVATGWKLRIGAALDPVFHTCVEDWYPDATANRWVRREILMVSDETQSLLATRTQMWRYEAIPATAGPSGINSLRLAQKEEWSGDRRTVTAYDYDLTSADLLRKTVTDSDGDWVIYQYDPAHNGRLATEYHAWLDGSPTTSETGCKVISYDYEARRTAWVADDDPLYLPQEPRLITTRILGKEVSRTYRGLKAGQTVEKVCVNLGSPDGYEDSGNLVTSTCYETSGNNAGRVKRITHPDGTIADYDYSEDSNGTFTTTVRAGEPEVEPENETNAVRNGTETVTAVGRYGELISRKVRPIRDGRFVKGVDGNDIMLSSEDYDYGSDPLKRDHTVRRLDGRTRKVSFGCCGISAETDWDGTVTSFGYDELGRLRDTTLSGITERTVFDVVGRVKRRERIGLNHVPMILEQFTYDAAGRLEDSINPLGATTHHQESITDHKRQVQTTHPQFPDAAIIEVYHRDGRLQQRSGTATTAVRYEYGVEPFREGETTVYHEFVKEIKLGPSGETDEWIKTSYDAGGRPLKVAYPDGAASFSLYNDRGQLWKEVDPDGVTTLFLYDGLGRREYQILALEQTTQDYTSHADLKNHLSTILAGTDRVTRTVRAVSTHQGSNVQRTDTIVYKTNGENTPTTVASSIESTDGNRSWQIHHPAGPVWPAPGPGATTRRETTYQGGGQRTETVTNPDNSQAVSLYLDGRLIALTRKDGDGNTVTQTSYDYSENYGRLGFVTDLRNGTTSYTYNNADQVLTTTTPAPGDGSGPQVTTVSYDGLGRRTGARLPDGTSTVNAYYPSGLLQETRGSRTYPVEYSYDTQARMKTMKTWRNHAGDSGAALTEWHYHKQRGWLVEKTYAGERFDYDSSVHDYTYTKAGRLERRHWERGVTTTYGYNAAGDLEHVGYSDTTPAVTRRYNRLGQLANVAHGSMTTDFRYNDAGQVTSETPSGGGLNGLSILRTYDASLRLDVLTAGQGNALLEADYDYDVAGRLWKVTSDADAVEYRYHDQSDLVRAISFSASSTTALVTTRTYDRLNRLQSVVSTPGGATLPLSYAYAYNPANQRTRMRLADGSYWVYAYDQLGQVIAGRRFWADGTAVVGQQFEYQFDDIGNRKTTGGRESAESTYWVNDLNQYTKRTVAGEIDVFGIANPGANVTVSGLAPDRHGEYFHRVVPVDNRGGSQYPEIIVASEYGSSQTARGHHFLPAEEELYDDPTTGGVSGDGYDADGNLEYDGRWHYFWDGENRLIRMERTATKPAGAQQRIEFEYDWQGRRIRKTTQQGNGQPTPTWALERDTVFLYDGWNLIGELDAANGNAKVRTYVWGTDLSGTMQGAGGVGGLLKVVHWTGPETSTRHFVACDGNGNVMGLVDAADGTISARYEYGPFGEPLRATGPQAANPFRFSSKYCDARSGFYYYGYRYYNPSTGRWLSRDPVGEVGFEMNRGRLPSALVGEPNRYLLVFNNVIGRIDYLGLEAWLNREYTMKAEWGMRFYLIASDSVSIKYPWGVSFKFFGSKRVTPITIRQKSGLQPGEVFPPTGTEWVGVPVVYEIVIDGPQRCGVTREPRWWGKCETQWYCSTATVRWKRAYDTK